MLSHAQAQETVPNEITAPLESEIISLEDSPDGETHVSVGVSGDEHVTGVFPPFDSTTFASQLVWLAISFAALYFVMSKLALPRIGSVLEERRDRINGDLAEADRLRQKTDDAIAAYETALAEARSQAHTIADQARAESKAKLDAERQRIESELSQKVAAAEARISETKANALEHVDEIASETAQAVVEQLLGGVSINEAREAVATVGKE